MRVAEHAGAGSGPAPGIGPGGLVKSGRFRPPFRVVEGAEKNRRPTPEEPPLVQKSHAVKSALFDLEGALGADRVTKDS